MWDLSWTKWHWDRFFSKIFSVPLSVSFHHDSPLSYIIWRIKTAAVQRHSLTPINMNNKGHFKIDNCSWGHDMCGEKS
jgi:hypothetical protein